MNSINLIAEKFMIPVIYSVYPRSKKVIEERKFIFHLLVRNLELFGFFDYNNLQKNSYYVLSDSGTLSEESVISNLPAIIIRTSTEKPGALDKGIIVLG